PQELDPVSGGSWRRLPRHEKARHEVLPGEHTVLAGSGNDVPPHPGVPHDDVDHRRLRGGLRLRTKSLFIERRHCSSGADSIPRNADVVGRPFGVESISGRTPGDDLLPETKSPRNARALPAFTDGSPTGGRRPRRSSLSGPSRSLPSGKSSASCRPSTR